MNQERINNLPPHLKAYAESLSDEVKAKLFPDEVINWEYVNTIRDKYFSYLKKKCSVKIQHNVLYTMQYTIDEFLDAFMQIVEVKDIGFNYDALDDIYEIWYEPIEEGENE